MLSNAPHYSDQAASREILQQPRSDFGERTVSVRGGGGRRRMSNTRHRAWPVSWDPLPPLRISASCGRAPHIGVVARACGLSRGESSHARGKKTGYLRSGPV